MDADAAADAGVDSKFILLTDIAGSSRLTEAYPQQYFAVLEIHNGLVEGIVRRHDGEVFKNLGDGYFALFSNAAPALAAAVDIQLAFNTEAQSGGLQFPDGTKLGVRTVVHGGQLTRLPGLAGDWFGPPLNRSARIGSVCHPGQLLISGVVRAALSKLPAELSELDLGQVRLRDLSAPERLIQLTHPGFARQQFPPLLGLDSRPNNLSLQPDAFIGRDREMAELARILSGGTRLLTLHAHGGYGKSRLASQLCAHLLWHFEHGVFEVQLAPVREHQHIPEAIADATGFQFSGSREPKQQVLDYLRHKELLLYLDNFEHLLDGAEYVAEILHTAQRVKILVTSREPLRLKAERVYDLEPLPLGLSGDAVQLFVDRAGQTKHGFELNQVNAELIERICARLGGIPLALELAAAWAGGFTLHEMYAELDRQLEMTTRLRDVPPRQHSVRASCDWSYSLLQLDQQQALRRLAIFVGGFFTEAAQAVLKRQGTDLRQMLSTLSDKSWLFKRDILWSLPGGDVATSRYYFRDAASHEYAAQLLLDPAHAEEQAETEVTHASYFAAFIAKEGLRLHGLSQMEALQAIKLELLNIYRALEALQLRCAAMDGRRTENGDEAPVGLLSWLLPFARWLWEYLDKTSDFQTMLERYTALVAVSVQTGGGHPVELWSRIGCGRANYQLSNYEVAKSDFQLALEQARRLGVLDAQGLCLVNLGNTEFWHGDQVLAKQYSGEALMLYRTLQDDQGIAAALHSLGLMECIQGDYTAADRLLSEALEVDRRIGDSNGIGYSLNNLANVQYTQGNYETAHRLYAEALTLQRGIGDRRGIAVALNNLGNVAYVQQRFSEAGGHYAEALALTREIGNRHGIAYSLYNLGVMDFMQGSFCSAQELFGEALAIQREIGDRHGIAETLNGLSSAEYMLGMHGQACRNCVESLEITREISHQPGLCERLAVAGCLLVAQDRLQTAALCLYGAVYHADQLSYSFQLMERQQLEHGLQAIAGEQTGSITEVGENAGASGKVTVKHGLAELRNQAEMLPLNELVQLAIEELADHGPRTGTNVAQDGA